GFKWIKQSIKHDCEYIVFGKPGKYGNVVNIVHPELEEASKFETRISTTLQSMYNTTEKMKAGFLNSKAIQKLQENLLKALGSSIPETLPEYMTKKFSLLPRPEAMTSIHFPENAQMLQKAQHRLKFEELFFIQLNLLRQKKHRNQKMEGFVFEKVGDCLNTFYAKNLHFELTTAQKRVIREIRADLGSGKQMNRLLQGDVGSGKTLVALMVMLIALDNGFQAAIMAPTEVLAQQHFRTIVAFLEGMDINVRLLTGSTRKKARQTIHEELINGENHILIGTHALIEDTVQFKNLGLVIIDEQHRFGVAQRAELWKKNHRPPHVLVMTATPIPRTLAMTLYGDLDISVIDEMPPGRKPVKTLHFFDSKRLRLFGFMKDQIRQGRQIYIVYPLIKESETMDYKDLTDGVESITRAFPPPQYAVSVVHGRMKTAEKDKSMKLFISGQTHVMVATTVIEVGVDVPNASVMVIESAERFGLTQLHQLRGRVGRGADQSYCVLMTRYDLSEDGEKRMAIMTRTTNGFEIAEADLQLRGPGTLEGTQQSGLPFDLKIADLGKDGQLLMYARNVAEKILDDDPALEKSENKILAEQLKTMKKSRVNWSRIS
ncbi:MAG: ATP-dependent DNA helicase RecG, partial [Bacteroidetes bacterium]|nr:ATP-dependent DNA helicase RecG [Bacteroidota bacterium]